MNKTPLYYLRRFVVRRSLAEICSFARLRQGFVGQAVILERVYPEQRRGTHFTNLPTSRRQTSTNLVHPKIIAAFLFSLVVSATAGWFLIGKTFAQGAPASVAISPATQPALLGDPVPVAVRVSGAENIGAYQFDVMFDPSIVQLTSVTDGGFLSTTGRTVVSLPPVIDNTTGVATVGAYSFGTASGPSGAGDLATLTFTAVGVGSTNLALGNVVVSDVTGTTQPTSETPGTIDIALAVPSPTPTPSTALGASPTPTPTPSPSSGPSATPTPTPASGTATLALVGPATAVVGEDVAFDLMLTTTSEIIGADAIVSFDPTRLTALGVGDAALFTTTPSIEIDNTGGFIKYSGVMSPGTGFVGQGQLATIRFRSLALDATQLRFVYTPGSKADSNVIERATGLDILVQPEAVTLDVVEEPLLQLALRTYSDDPVLGHHVDGTLTIQGSAWTIDLSTDKQGISQAVNLSTSLVNQLTEFLFNTAGYLGERFAIVVSPGLNIVDLGLLRPGDLNDDDVINTLDLSLMYDQWFGAGTADLNRDGVVNVYDYWILTQNFLGENE